MLRATFLLFLLPLSLFPAPLLSQECLPGTSSSRIFRTPALDLSVDGNDLWVATSFGVMLYERNGTELKALATLPVPGVTRRVGAASRHAWVASGSTLYSVGRQGGSPAIIGSLELGDQISDLLLIPPYAFLATSGGVVQVDLLRPEQPVVANRLTTTAGGAISLARRGAHLYAADGDLTVEVYSINLLALPQKVGTFNALPRTTSIQAVGERLFATDGQQTMIFAGSGAAQTFIASLPVAAASVVEGPRPVVIAGGSRFITGVDLLEGAAPAILFESELPLTTGVSRVERLAAAEGALYVAGGDAGLLVYDTRKFAAPFPHRTWRVGAARSVVVAKSAVVSDAGELGLTHFHFATVVDPFMVQPGGYSLSRQGSWDEDRQWRVLDAHAEGVDTRTILASSGGTIAVWEVRGYPPRLISKGPVPGTIRSGILRGDHALVVLSDNRVWGVSLTQTVPQSERIDAAGAASSIARGDGAIATVELRADGMSTIRYWASGDLSAAPQTVQVEGAATSGVAINGSGQAAVATFRGLLLADFASGAPPVVLAEIPPGSAIAMDGNHLYAAAGSRVQQWNVSQRRAVREYELSHEISMLFPDQGQTVWAATAGGLSRIETTATGEVPQLVRSAAAGAAYRWLRTSGEFIALVSEREVSTMRVDPSQRIVRLSTFPLAAIPLEVAMVGDRLYLLGSSGRVSAVGLGGIEVASYQLEGGADAVPIGLRSIGPALHLSYLRGCSAGNCEKRTIVLDPRNGLVETSSYGGGIVDAVSDGSVAFVITDLPSELRRLNLADPFHPVVTAAVPLDEAAVSISWSAARSRLYLLGDRLSVHDAGSLTRLDQQLEPWRADPSGRLSYEDQRITVEGDCLLITGRWFAPRLLRLADLTPAGSLTVPSAVRQTATAGGLRLFLTEHSLEVMNEGSAGRPRSARPGSSSTPAEEVEGRIFH
jgi:hypothetical protein